MAGIVGYGAYIPRFRLKVEDIWDVWVNPIDTPAIIKERTRLTEKAVSRWDEDSVTMSVVAAKASLESAGIAADELNAVYFGSCTNPYTSKAAVSIITEALTDKKEMFCADVQFAARSGTAALQIGAALCDAGQAKLALAIGSDTLSRHVAPNDPMEYSASCGAAAFILGTEKVIAKIDNMYSYNTQSPEFFRLDGERYIKHAASEDGETLWGYRKYVKAAIAGFLKKFDAKPADFTYIAIGQPDGKMPVDVSSEIGFSQEQITPGLIAPEIGDCGSASSLLSLQTVLDQAKPGEKILLVAYGFGAGCDVFSLETTNLLSKARKRRATYPSVKDLINAREYIAYAQYLRQERKIVQEFV